MSDTTTENTMTDATPDTDISQTSGTTTVDTPAADTQENDASTNVSGSATDQTTTAESSIKELYPQRYYAGYDITAAQPTIVLGWYDTWDMNDVSNIPKASDMIAISESDWNNTSTFRLTHGRGVYDGKILDYTPPVAPIPLSVQATSALADARSYVMNNYAILNLPTPNTWVTYLKALMNIADGTDTTSTSLPTAPTA